MLYGKSFTKHYADDATYPDPADVSVDAAVTWATNDLKGDSARDAINEKCGECAADIGADLYDALATIPRNGWNPENLAAAVGPILSRFQKNVDGWVKDEVADGNTGVFSDMFESH